MSIHSKEDEIVVKAYRKAAALPGNGEQQSAIFLGAIMEILAEISITLDALRK